MDACLCLQGSGIVTFEKHLEHLKPALSRAWLLEKPLLIHAVSAVIHFHILHTIQLDTLARQLDLTSHSGAVLTSGGA